MTDLQVVEADTAQGLGERGDHAHLQHDAHHLMIINMSGHGHGVSG